VGVLIFIFFTFLLPARVVFAAQSQAQLCDIMNQNDLYTWSQESRVVVMDAWALQFHEQSAHTHLKDFCLQLPVFKRMNLALDTAISWLRLGLQEPAFLLLSELDIKQVSANKIVQWRYAYALALSFKQQYTQALEVLNPLLLMPRVQLNEQWPPSHVPAYALVCLLKARLLKAQGQIKEALLMYQNIESEQALWQELYTERAWIYWQNKQAEQMFAQLKSADVLKSKQRLLWELDVLSASLNWQESQYEQAALHLDMWFNTYRQYQEEKQKFLAIKITTFEQFKNHISTYKSLIPLWVEIRRTPHFLWVYQSYIKLLEHQNNVLSANKESLQVKSYLSQIWQVKDKDVVSKIETLFMQSIALHWQKLDARLEYLMLQAQLLYVDKLLHDKNALMSLTQVQYKQEPFKPLSLSLKQDYYFWDQEYWQDELGLYQKQPSFKAQLVTLAPTPLSLNQETDWLRIQSQLINVLESVIHYKKWSVSDTTKLIKQHQLAELYDERAAFYDARNKAQALTDRAQAQLLLKNMVEQIDEQASVWHVPATQIYNRIDAVLFHQASLWAEQGDQAAFARALNRLINEWPQSLYIKEAQVLLGDYYFNNNQFQNAMAYYQAIQSDNESRHWVYVLYKMAWCEYNMQHHAESLALFRRVMTSSLASNQNKTGVGALNLYSESMMDLLWPLAETGVPLQAFDVLKSILKPQDVPPALLMLAKIYRTQGRLLSAQQVLQLLDLRASNALFKVSYLCQALSLWLSQQSEQVKNTQTKEFKEESLLQNSLPYWSLVLLQEPCLSVAKNALCEHLEELLLNVIETHWNLLNKSKSSYSLQEPYLNLIEVFLKIYIKQFLHHKNYSKVLLYAGVFDVKQQHDQSAYDKFKQLKDMPLDLELKPVWFEYLMQAFSLSYDKFKTPEKELLWIEDYLKQYLGEQFDTKITHAQFAWIHSFLKYQIKWHYEYSSSVVYASYLNRYWRLLNRLTPQDTDQLLWVERALLEVEFLLGHNAFVNTLTEQLQIRLKKNTLKNTTFKMYIASVLFYTQEQKTNALLMQQSNGQTESFLSFSKQVLVQQQHYFKWIESADEFIQAASLVRLWQLYQHLAKHMQAINQDKQLIDAVLKKADVYAAEACQRMHQKKWQTSLRTRLNVDDLIHCKH